MGFTRIWGWSANLSTSDLQEAATEYGSRESGIVPLNRVATNLDKTSMQLRKAT